MEFSVMTFDFSVVSDRVEYEDFVYELDSHDIEYYEQDLEGSEVAIYYRD